MNNNDLLAAVDYYFKAINVSSLNLLISKK